MKHLLIFFFLLMGFAANAQTETNKNEEKIQALYIAYITRELKLSEDEAQKFWPIHTEFDRDIRNVNLDMPELDRQQAALNIKKKYQERFIRIIGNNRTNDFYVRDGEFRKKLIERLKNIRQQNQNDIRQRQGIRKNRQH